MSGISGTKKTVGGLTIALAVVGSVMLLGSAAAGAVSAVRYDGGSHSIDLSEAASTATDLKAEVAAADLTIEYHSGSDVVLEASGNRADRWQAKIEDGTIRVKSPGRGWDWFGDGWFGDWFDGGDLPFDWSAGEWNTDAGARATLRLPESLKGLDAYLKLEAGRLSVDGDLGQIDATVNAGALSLDGTAEQVAVTVNAGEANVDLDGVQTGTYDVNAGRVISQLSGDLSALTLRVSAGAIDLTLPDSVYDLRREVAAGSLNSDLSEARDAAHRIDANVMAGTVTLQADRTQD